MDAVAEWLARGALVGVGATAVMDAWAWLLRRGFGEPSLDYALVGRWIGHWRRGRFRHAGIVRAEPVRGERALGWLAHYLIGVVFALLLLAACGAAWWREPTPGPALLFGLASVAAPFLLMQPAMGAGFFAAKTPQPWVTRRRSLMAHASFGVGLYAAAWVLAPWPAL
ncbi:membrane protein [Chromobacterium sp. LK1]|uniref:DUF2938 domain-containing protein n=1 Tax=Chromobacterium sp. LK1 TaxID=1628193 RepID=UPI000653CBB3|nr:DUF2938 domain-containing protein [Chromobacterium sp. LK1]KMN30639.1 membrane protein [Chromobacterium sp. LK1]